jgi:sulfur-oxidizing protein SoxZ
VTQPTRIRAQTSGDRTVVRMLLGHEMESGQRKDAAGQTIPAWFIREVSVLLNGRPVLAAQWGPSVAKNPLVQFSLKGAKPGDRITVAWVDNRGERRSDEGVVSAS